MDGLGEEKCLIFEDLKKSRPDAETARFAGRETDFEFSPGRGSHVRRVIYQNTHKTVFGGEKSMGDFSRKKPAARRQDFKVIIFQTLAPIFSASSRTSRTVPIM